MFSQFRLTKQNYGDSLYITRSRGTGEGLPAMDFKNFLIALAIASFFIIGTTASADEPAKKNDAKLSIDKIAEIMGKNTVRMVDAKTIAMAGSSATFVMSHSNGGMGFKGTGTATMGAGGPKDRVVKRLPPAFTGGAKKKVKLQRCR